jgi:hypothetical protein
VVDDNGTTANATLDVNVIDDLPKAVNDSNANTASETNADADRQRPDQRRTRR